MMTQSLICSNNVYRVDLSTTTLFVRYGYAGEHANTMHLALAMMDNLIVTSLSLPALLISSLLQHKVQEKPTKKLASLK